MQYYFQEEPLYTSSSLHISSNKSKGIIKAYWQGELTPNELELGYKQIHLLLEKRTYYKCLIDTRRRAHIAVTTIEQVIQEFFPRLISMLDSDFYICFLMNPEQYMYSLESMNSEKLNKADNLHLIIHVTTDQDEAEEWLMEQE